MKSYNNKKSKVNILIHFDKTSFYVGENIKGNIEINSNSSALIRDIIIEIFATEDWKIKEGEKIKSESLKAKLINYKLNLINSNLLKTFDDENLLLPIGITFIPFNFRFSENITPCFEYPNPEKRAFVRYSLIASIDSSNITGSGSVPLFLLSRPIIDSEKKLNLSCVQMIKKWKLFGEGNTTLNVSIPEDNFKYTSVCKINIEIDNTTGKIATKEFKVTLVRIISFKDRIGKIKNKDSKKIIRTRVKAIVKPGYKNTFNFDLTFIESNLKNIYNYINQANPYNAALERINFFMPTIKGRIISCDYNIKVSVYFDSFVDKSHRPRVKFPVYLVHQLPVDYQLEIEEQIEMNKALKLSMFEDNNNSKSNNDKYLNENAQYKNDFFDNNLNKNQNNYNQNEDKENNELPTLELIEKQRQKENENAYNEKIENKNNDFEINHPYNNEGAPVPFGFIQKRNNFNNINNPNFNENYNKINEDNNIIKKNSTENFTLFNDDENDNVKEQYYEDINAI